MFVCAGAGRGHWVPFSLALCLYSLETGSLAEMSLPVCHCLARLVASKHQQLLLVPPCAGTTGSWSHMAFHVGTGTWTLAAFSIIHMWASDWLNHLVPKPKLWNSPPFSHSFSRRRSCRPTSLSHSTLCKTFRSTLLPGFGSYTIVRNTIT